MGYKFHLSLLLLVFWFGATVWAQNVTTLTPTPFNASAGLSVDAEGNIFVANMGNRFHDGSGKEIYKVTPVGEVSLFADGFLMATANTFDSQGNLYQASYDWHRVDKISPDGVVTAYTGTNSGIDNPSGLAFDSQGNLYVANCNIHTIRKITPGGVSTEFVADNPLVNCPTGLAFDDQGNLYVTHYRTSLILKVTPAGTVSTFADSVEWTGTNGRNEFMIFAHERFYIAGYGSNRVFELSLTGELTVLAGNGEPGRADGPLLEARLQQPMGIDISPDGRLLYVNTSEYDNFTGQQILTPNVVRVIELPGVRQEDFQINAGLNDAWFNLATAGQGFLITVFPDRKEVFLAWFTYDTERPPEDVTAFLGEPGHRWLTAQGPYDGDTATLTIFMTEGGVFDAAEPAASTDPAGDGTLTLQFADCTEGLVNYEIASLGISGEIPIERITPDNVALCETLASP